MIILILCIYCIDRTKIVVSEIVGKTKDYVSIRNF